MRAIINSKSTLKYWRFHRDEKINGVRRSHGNCLPVNIPDIDSWREKMPAGLSYPIDILVGSANAIRKSEIFKQHVYTRPTPGGCFVDIGDGIAVCSPEFTFFQMASEISLVKLIQLGLEFCGTYSLPADDKNKELDVATLYNRVPLTCVKDLKSFTARMRGVNGQKNTVWALRHIADRSASPMETIVFMLLTLPVKHGGYSLPAPQLNKQIDIGKLGTQISGKNFNRCDLYCPEARLAVEYDSDTYHTGAERLAEDSKRRSALKAIGIEVITITAGQIKNATEFDGMAKLIAKALGKRLRYHKTQFLKAQNELRSQLF